MVGNVKLTNKVLTRGSRFIKKEDEDEYEVEQKFRANFGECNVGSKPWKI